MSRTPASSARSASSGALRETSSQPSRIFSVTGTLTALTTASISVSAWSRSRISADPAAPLVTFLAGQPMLMSMMSAPPSSAMRAPSAIQRASQPASWTTCSPAPCFCTRRRAMRFPAASAAHAVISEITSPAPCPATMRRNGASVMPDIGASRTGLGRATGPMQMVFMTADNRFRGTALGYQTKSPAANRGALFEYRAEDVLNGPLGPRDSGCRECVTSAAASPDRRFA